MPLRTLRNQAQTPSAAVTKAASVRERRRRTNATIKSTTATTSHACWKTVRALDAASARRPSSCACASVSSTGGSTRGSLDSVSTPFPSRGLSVDRHGYVRVYVARLKARLVVAWLHAYGRVYGVTALRGGLVGAKGEPDEGPAFVDRERLVAEAQFPRHGFRVDGRARRDAFLRFGPDLGRHVELVGGGVGVDVEPLGDVEPDVGLARAARVQTRLLDRRRHDPPRLPRVRRGVRRRLHPTRQGAPAGARVREAHGQLVRAPQRVDARLGDVERLVVFVVDSYGRLERGAFQAYLRDVHVAYARSLQVPLARLLDADAQSD